MSRRDAVEQQFQNMKVYPIFQFENGEYVYVQYNKKLDRLEAGGCCNAGFYATDTMAYDHDFLLSVTILFDMFLLSSYPAQDTST